MNKAGLLFADIFNDILEAHLLEVGSLNVNGSLREVLPVDFGIDMRDGDGVDSVCLAEDLPTKHPGPWGAIACANMLEHAEHWDKVMKGMWDVLAPNGLLLLITCNQYKALHGYPNDYWRFDQLFFRQMFKGQFLYAIATIGFSECVIVQKVTDKLNLNLTPLPIKFKATP